MVLLEVPFYQIKMYGSIQSEIKFKIVLSHFLSHLKKVF